MSVDSIITENLDIWTSAIKTKSSSGRGNSSKLELYGIKKLRELIVDYAVHGKFTADRTYKASPRELVEKAIKEKNELAKERKLRDSKIEYTDAVGGEFPEHWEVVNIGQIAHVLGGKRVPKGYSLLSDKTNHVYLRVTDMKRNSIDDSDLRYITPEVYEQIERYTINEQDLYITIAGTIGSVGTIPKHLDGANLTENAAKLVFREISKDYLVLILTSKYVQNQFEIAVNQMAQPKLSLNSIKTTLIPIPSKTEQEEIVARVEKLMSLCDQLESQTEASIEAHQTLVKSLLETLTNAKDADELNDSWQRISAHFDVLFTTEDSIDQLKQTVLQLAVMGKLVKQDPNDEPASKLLERIAAEKEQLIKDKKIKKQKPLAPITDDEISSKLPNDWSWCRLNEIISIMDAGWSPACPPEPSPSIDKWGVLKTTAVQKLEFLENENKVLAESKDPKAQYEVKSGDILITRAGPRNRVGISCLVRNTRPRLMISDKIIRFHLVHSDLDEEFISLCLNAGVTAEYLEKSKSGMADSQVNISQDKLKMAPIPLAPLRQQREIVAKVYALWTLCEELKLNVVKLRDIRNCVADSFIIHS